MADRSSFSKTLSLIVAAGAVVRLVLLVMSAIDRDFLVAFKLPDDALYYFAIAENVKHAFHAPILSYDGLHPTNGMHPLWVFVIAPIFMLGLTKWSAAIAVLALQTILDCAAVWLVGRTVYEALSESAESNRRTAAIFAAALYAFNAVVVLRAINGLETTLAALLLVLWFRATLRVLRGDSATVLGIVTGLLLLARTDTALIIAPAMLWLIGHADVRNRALRVCAIAVVLILPWFLWNLVTFGSIMQSSGLAVPFFAMKKYDVIYTSVGKIRHLGFEAIKNILKPWLLAGVLVPLASVIVAWRRRRSEPLLQLIALVAIGSMILMAVHSIFRGFIREWYVLMQIPLVLVLFGVAAGRYAEGFEVRSGARLRLAIVLIVLILPFALKAPYDSQRLIVGRGIPAIERLTPTARVAALNSGFYGYFAKRPGSVVNIDGVVNYDAYEAIRDGKLELYLLKDSVDYVLDLAGDLGGYKGLIDRSLLSDFEFDTRWSLAGRSEELVLYRRKK